MKLKEKIITTLQKMRKAISFNLFVSRSKIKLPKHIHTTEMRREERFMGTNRWIDGKEIMKKQERYKFWCAGCDKKTVQYDWHDVGF